MTNEKLYAFLGELTDLCDKHNLYIVSDIGMDIEDIDYEVIAFNLSFNEDKGKYEAIYNEEECSRF